MSLLKKGQVVYASRNGITIYQEPVKNDAVWKATKTGQKKAYYDWSEGQRIGTITGQVAEKPDGTWIQINCELVWWRKRVVDWVREDKLGYVLLSDLSIYHFGDTLPNPDADAPKNTPVPDTTTGNTGTNTNGTDTGTGTGTSTNTILWVVVAVLAIVAGFFGFKKLSK